MRIVSAKHAQEFAVDGKDVSDAKPVEHGEMDRVEQRSVRRAPALFDGAATLLQIGEGDRVDMDLTAGKPLAGRFRSERGDNQLVRRGQGEVRREEPETTGDEVVVRAHGRHMRSIVSIGQGNQRRRINECDTSHRLIGRLREQV